MTEGLLKLIDVFIPPAARSAEGLLRARFAVGISACAALLSVLFLIINARAGHEAMAGVYLAGTLATLGSLALFRATGRVVAVLQACATVVSGMLVVSCVQFGKADVGTLIYFAILPLALFFVGGLRLGLLWLAIGLLLSAAIFAADVAGLMPPPAARNSLISDAANVFGVIGLSFFFSYLFYALNTRANLELDAANRQLRDARTRAEDANRAKSLFLATMTHEMRTPMNGVIGLTNMMLDGQLEPAQRELAGTLKRSGEALLELIDDILDFEKIEAGRIDLDDADVDARALTQGVLDLLEFRASEKNLRLHATVDASVAPLLRTDAARVRQVLLNLAGNALKFTEKGEVEIRVAQRDGRLLFSVRDTGIGIPPQHRPKLFLPFSQGDSSMARRFGGSGLGLAISRRLVEALGGEIEFTSEVGVGSTFSFSIPVRAAGPAPAAVDPPVPPKADLHALGFHALVVEDNPVNAQVTVHLLRARGVSSDVAADGNAALELLGRSRFDIIFMDCQMPALDGFETTRRWRVQEPNRHTPIVAMTAATQPSDRDAAIAAGMDDYLTKPVLPSELDRVLNRFRDVIEVARAH